MNKGKDELFFNIFTVMVYKFMVVENAQWYPHIQVCLVQMESISGQIIAVTFACIFFYRNVHL